MITIETSKGPITLEMHEKEAPETVANFLAYSAEGFYDGTVFHRVIPGFMIQGGGMDADMTQKETKAPINNEAKSAKPNARGTIAMARTSAPHSATAQFFINVADNSFLNFTREDMQGFGYCVFGHVVQGMDIVDAIAAVATGSKQGHSDVPVEPITIISVRSV